MIKERIGIYKRTQLALIEGHFEDVDRWLELAYATPENYKVGISLVRASFVAKDKLPNWKVFLLKLKRALEAEFGVIETARKLRGLL